MFVINIYVNKYIYKKMFLPISVLQIIISMGNIIFSDFSDISPWKSKANSVGKGLDAERTPAYLSRFVLRTLPSAEESVLLCSQYFQSQFLFQMTKGAVAEAGSTH